MWMVMIPWMIKNEEQGQMIQDGNMDIGQKLGTETMSHATFARP
jgi:hypothetical protein